MREIIFRGKRLDNGEWVYGHIYTQVDLPDTIEEEWYWYINPIGSGSWVSYRVDPYTVGQYTGLKAKDGKRIFEGDIIKADNGNCSYISVVKFGRYYPKMFYAMLDMCCPGTRHLTANGFYAETTKHEAMILFKSPYLEVIGNIHDNPELIFKE